MTDLREITFAETDLDALKDAEGRVAVFVNGAGQLGRGARRLNRLTKGALARAVADEGWEAKAAGDVVTLAYPVGMEAEAVDVVRLERRPTVAEARKAGATLARIAGGSPLTILGETLPRLPQLLLGLSLRGYAFTDHKSDKGKAPAPAHVFCSKPDETEAACKEALALAEEGARRMGAAERFSTRQGDAFDTLTALGEEGARFGLVICDPPAFAPAKPALEAGLRAYEKVARLSAPLVEEGGYLVLCSCSHAADLSSFTGACLRGIGRAGRRAQLVHTGFAGPDHPLLPQLAESGYLKALVFRL